MAVSNLNMHVSENDKSVDVLRIRWLAVSNLNMNVSEYDKAVPDRRLADKIGMTSP